MKYGTSLRTRHLVGRFEKGEELIEALRQLCARERVRAGFFQAIGLLSAAELQEYVPDQRDYNTIFRAKRPLEVLSLTGDVSTMGPETILHTRATLAYTTHGQVQLVGGYLRTARAFACEFTLVVYDDLSLERTHDPATNLPMWNRIQSQQLLERPMSVRTNGSSDSPEASPEVSAGGEQAVESTPDEALEAVGVHVARTRSEPLVVHRRGARPDTNGNGNGNGNGNDESDEGAPASAASAPRPAGADAWAAAAAEVAALERRTRATATRAEPEPEPVQPPRTPSADDITRDDILVHPEWGRCRVKRAKEDGRVLVRVIDGLKDATLSLQPFDVRFIEREGTHNVFQLRGTAPSRAGADDPLRPDPPSSSRLEIPEGVKAEREVDEEEFNELLQRGDVLRHPQLGNCVVESVEDLDHVSVRIEGRRKPRRLNISIFKLVLLEDDDTTGTSTFRLKKRARR